MIARVKQTRETPFSQIPSSRDTPGASPGISDRSDGFRLRRDETGFSLWRDIGRLGRPTVSQSVRRSSSSSSSSSSSPYRFWGKRNSEDEGITELKQRKIIAVFLLYPFPKVQEILFEKLKRKAHSKSWMIVIVISKKSDRYIIFYYLDENLRIICPNRKSNSCAWYDDIWYHHYISHFIYLNTYIILFSIFL